MIEVRKGMYDLINYVLFWFVQIIQIGETVFLLFFFFQKKKKRRKNKGKAFQNFCRGGPEII